MKKFIIAIMMLVLCESVLAASAYWTGIRVVNDGIHSDGLGEYYLGGYIRGESGNGADIISNLYGHFDNGNVYLKHQDFSGESMNATFNWWALAVYGDIVDAETFAGDKFTHIEDFHDYDYYTGGTLVPDPSDFYMVFKVSEVLIENHDYVAGQSWYGWVHVSIDENLDMTLLGEGINLYGGSVIVGAIPEPSSVLLLLVGGALLLLRRGRFRYDLFRGGTSQERTWHYA